MKIFFILYLLSLFNVNTIIYAAEKRKGVGSIDLQMTYNTNVITDVRKHTSVAQ